MKKKKICLSVFATVIFASSVIPPIPAYAMVEKQDLINYGKGIYQEAPDRPASNNVLKVFSLGFDIYYLDTNHGRITLPQTFMTGQFFRHNYAIDRAGDSATHIVFLNLPDREYAGFIRQALNLLQAEDLNSPFHPNQRVTNDRGIEIRMFHDKSRRSAREFIIPSDLIRTLPGFQNLRAVQLFQTEGRANGFRYIEDFRLRIVLAESLISDRQLIDLEPIAENFGSPVHLVVQPHTGRLTDQPECSYSNRDRNNRTRDELRKRDTDERKERPECLVKYHTPYHLSLSGSKPMGIEKEERNSLIKFAVSGPDFAQFGVWNLFFGKFNLMGWLGNKILDSLSPLEEKLQAVDKNPAFVKVEPVTEGHPEVRSGDKIRLRLEDPNYEITYLHTDGRLVEEGEKRNPGTAFTVRTAGEEEVIFVDEKGKAFSMNNKEHFSFILPSESK